jgi:hypothetical protein
VKRESIIAPSSETSVVAPEVAAQNLIARLDARSAAFDGTQKRPRPRTNPGSDQKPCRKYLGHHHNG